MKVQIQLHGKTALVDSDQVKMLKQKESLVGEATALQFDPTSNVKNSLKYLRIAEIMSKIINLNRRIRKNVQYL